MSSSSREAPKASPTAVRDSRLLRYVFYAFWIAALPLGLSILGVWIFTPAEGDAAAGGLRRFVEAQQIPVGIIFFTFFALTLWRFRYELPMAGSVGMGGRRDVPPKLRGRFEDAGALLDEANRIMRARKREVARELTSSEREQLESAIVGLEAAIASESFDAEEFDRAHAKADRAIGEHLARWRKGEMREYAESIAIAVAVALLLRAFVVEAFKIPSGSMIPTLMIGDHIFVNKFTYGPLVPWTQSRVLESLPPARGDIAVFKFPENEEQDFIKRMIAIPGDRLEAIDGRPIINGWLVPHCRVGTYHYDGRDAELFVEFLGDYSYFTLYDNPPDDTTCATSKDCPHAKSCRAGVCGMPQGPFQVKPAEAWVMGDNRNNSHDSRSWRGGLGAGVPFRNMKGRAMFVWMSFGPGGGIAQDRLLVNVMGRPELPDAYDDLRPTLDKCLRERPKQTSPPPGGSAGGAGPGPDRPE